MTIGRKLYSSFGAVLAMVLVLFLVNLTAVYREHSAKAAAGKALQLADASDKVRFQMMQNRLYLSNYLLSGDSREVERMNDGARVLEDKLRMAESLAESDQQRSAIQKVQQTEQNWARDFATPLEEKRKEVDSGNATVAELQIFYLQKDASSWVKAATEYLDAADQENKKVIEDRRKSDESASTWTVAIALISTLVALVLGIVIAYTSAKSITQPLNELMTVAQRIGNAGDLDHEINISRKDEIGELARTFSSMVSYLREMASVSEAIAGGNLSVEVIPRSKQDTLGNAFSRMIEGLNKINSTSRSSGEIIDVLSQRADDIGKIIEVIDDLAEQTNLLALNAAIEAARAGEHGLGFAVVADEVRKLAEKSAQSTKEISELIQSIQKEARKAVENMERSTGIVNDGLGLGQELNAALRKISNVVTEVYKFAQEIGAATNEQSHGSSQIARATTRLNEITHEINSAVEEQASGADAVVKAMERMRELTQQSTSGSTELAASAEQMSKMSRGLLESMDRFALRDADSGHVAHREEKPAAKTVARYATAGQN